MPYQLAWLIFLIPFFGFVVNALIIKPFARKESLVSGYIAIGAVGAALALSLWTLVTVAGSPSIYWKYPSLTGWSSATTLPSRWDCWSTR